MDVCIICGAMPKEDGPKFFHRSGRIYCQECFWDMDNARTNTEVHVKWNVPVKTIPKRTLQAMGGMIQAAIKAIKEGKLGKH